MHNVLRALGKDSVMFMAADEFPLPYEDRFFAFDGLVSIPPADLAERTIIFLDCGNIDRLGESVFKDDGRHILNIDHHHDNTRFGSVNLVVEDASCTAEIVWDLMRALDVDVTPAIADALYVGLVTDTGKFMYENTGTRAHIMAAELVAAGVDVHEIYRRLYEDMPYAKLSLLARGLTNVQRFDDGALTCSFLSREDFAAAEAEESYSEGIIDHLRSVAGTKVARSRASCSIPTVRACARCRCGPPTARSTCRPSPGPGEAGGTARPPASPPSSPRRSSWSSCATRSRRSWGAPTRRAEALVDGVLLVDKPAGVTSHDVVAGVRRTYGRGVKVGHAGTLDPFATGLLLILVGRATRAQRWLMGLDKTYETVAWLGATSTTGDPEGEIAETGVMPPTRPSCPPARSPSARPSTARSTDGERLCPPAGETVEIRASGGGRAVHPGLARRRPGRVHHHLLVGTYIRSLIMDLAMPTAWSCAAHRSGRSPWGRCRPGPDVTDGLIPLGDALAAVMPVIHLDDEQSRLAAHGRPVTVPSPDVEHVLLRDDEGPVAVAIAGEPGVRRPVVGFRG